MKSIVIMGQPNSGKTQLFNQLTKQQATVGNWSGVTVDAQSGLLCSDSLNHEPTEVIDLPGIYSIHHSSENKDEKITLSCLRRIQPSLIVHVVNACQLERSLLLTTELLTLGIPMVIVLTMIESAKNKGISIKMDVFSQLLRCPVIALKASLDNHSLRQAIDFHLSHLPPPSAPVLPLPPTLAQAIEYHQKLFYTKGETWHGALMSAYHYMIEDTSQTDLIFAKAYSDYAKTLFAKIQITTAQPRTDWTEQFDRIFLHRFFALPLFFSLMYLLFFGAIRLGGVFQSFFDLSTQAIFVQGTAVLMQQLALPLWLISLISDGLGKGLNTTCTFIPVLGVMYFFLSFLENSGYMARAAFIMDRAMRVIGLPGKAFVPLIIGFGCNVPAILATRTLNKRTDRILTAMMAPFMSCSARLTIYTVFASTFFPQHGEMIVFSLYLLGILIALLTGWMLRKLFVTGDPSPLILELPPYQLPQFKHLCFLTFYRLSSFLNRAARIILPTCLILAASQLIVIPSWITPHQHSTLLAFFGQLISPLFSPMGLTATNWPAVVGLLTGVLAKEVVIGTMNTLYQTTQPSILVTSHTILQTLQEAIASTNEQLHSLGQAFLHPLLNQAELQTVPSQFHLFLQHHFQNTASLYAYLVFILLYLPCISTMAAIKQETSSRFMWFSVFWSCFIAYTTSTFIYQLFSFGLHPFASCNWIIGIIGMFLLLQLRLNTSSFSTLAYFLRIENEEDNAPTFHSNCGGCSHPNISGLRTSCHSSLDSHETIATRTL